MMMSRSRVVTVPVTIAMLLVQCSANEREQPSRELELAQQEDETQVDANAIVRRQRDLFVALSTGQTTAELTTKGFAVRNERSMTPSDSSYEALRRQGITFQILNVRPQLDTSAIAAAGDLMGYSDFRTYPLGANQTVVLARNEHGSTIFTNWLRSSNDWDAAGMVVNASQSLLDRLNEHWSKRVAR